MCVRKCTRALTFENAVAKSWEVIQMYQQLQRGAPSSKSSKSGVCLCVCVCDIRRYTYTYTYKYTYIYRLTDDEWIHESGRRAARCNGRAGGQERVHAPGGRGPGTDATNDR
jgi:hypothetical protein